jgi:hypothetical protein
MQSHKEDNVDSTMNTTHTTRHAGEDRIASWLRYAFAGIAASLASFAYAKNAPSVEPARPSAAATTRAAQLFAEAVREDSNLAMDWLWYAEQMTSDAARRYCVERALAIDPDNELARRALVKLPPASTPDEALLFARPVASGASE